MFERRKVAKLEANRNREAIEACRSQVAQLPDSNGVISIDAFQTFMQSATDAHVDLDSVPGAITALRLGLAQGGCFIAIDTALLLKKDEGALWEARADLLKEVVDREFRGGSRGVSVPLGGGVRYRVGAVRGHTVTVGTHWATADVGVLTVTDQRVVYHGGRKTLEFAFAKLVTLTVYSDAVDLGVTNRQSTSTLRVGDPELFAGILHAALDHRDAGVTLVRLTSA